MNLLLNSKKIPYFILGKGSNLLVSDKGIEGVVISLDGLDSVQIDGETIVCGAGAAVGVGNRFFICFWYLFDYFLSSSGTGNCATASWRSVSNG